MREEMRLQAWMLMEREISEQIGDAKHQRTSDRKTQWNGYRERS